MNLSVLDGRGYAKFVAAGAFFVRQYRGVLNDLNVFPVPDGDTGTNMSLTIRSAAADAGKRRGCGLGEVAAAAAAGALMGARGNSGVLLSQLLRGFAHHLRDCEQADASRIAGAMREGVLAARSALSDPVEGTILSVAHAAAEAAYDLALEERDLYRVARAAVAAAAAALERTPEQLPALKAAGVVDAGGAGLLYFLEGILRFMPGEKVRATEYVYRPTRGAAFTPQQRVGENRYCTEFSLESARCEAETLRDALSVHGDSLIVAGAAPTLKVHIHTGQPENVRGSVEPHGTITAWKVDDMKRQHRVLLAEVPEKRFAVVAAVPGPGFERIVKELGADVVVGGALNPSVRDFVLAINKAPSRTVFVFPNDGNAIPAAIQAAALSEKHVETVPTRSIPAGIAALLQVKNEDELPELAALTASAMRARGGSLFFAGKDASLGDVRVARGQEAGSFDGRLFAGSDFFEVAIEMVRAMGAPRGGLITCYYGGSQQERDARHLSEKLRSAFPLCEVEYYFGGQKNEEYVISFDE
ncbi:MAG: DAK2 domain-containing protein [Vulcanimicrobiaceae bacterium]